MNENSPETRRQPDTETAVLSPARDNSALDLCKKCLKASVLFLGVIVGTMVKLAWEIWGQEESSTKDEETKHEIDELKTHLFHIARQARNFDEAEKRYHQLVTDKGLSLSDDLKILDLRQAFAEMLMEQGRFEEAEPMVRAIWERRNSLGTLSEENKQSHRQLCSILCSMRRYKEAEVMHRAVYNKSVHDAWSLENGDELCQRLADQNQYDDAKCTQRGVWKERKQQFGQRDRLTIRSGARTIAFLENLLAPVGGQACSGVRRRHRKSLRETYLAELELMLDELWDSHVVSDSDAEILNAGHKLGVIKHGRGDFVAAQAIFEQVWEFKKASYGEGDDRSLSTASMLGKTLLRQGNPEVTRRAIGVFDGVWAVRRSSPVATEAEMISSGEDLAQAYCSMSDFPNAENIYRFIMTCKRRSHGWLSPETIRTRWDLSKVLSRQGAVKSRDTEDLLRELYGDWNRLPSPPKEKLECGCMLAHTLSAYGGKDDEALTVMRDVFSRREAIETIDVLYFESRRLFGELLLKGGHLEEAETTLESAWDSEIKGPEENIRLKCGFLFGRCLHDRKKRNKAKEVLEAVREAQKLEAPTGDAQVAEIDELLRSINEKLGQKAKRSSKTQRRRGMFF